MSSLLRPRAILSILALTLPACVVRLTDRNSPAENGAVTGVPANCKALQGILGKGGPDGAAEPKFVGRFLFPAKGDPENGIPARDFTVFDWSGNYIQIRFKGTEKVTVKLSLPPSQNPQDQMVQVALDNLAPVNRQVTVTRDPKTNKPTITPAPSFDVTGLSKGEHELTIWKNTEAQKGALEFRGFELNGGELLPPNRRPRRMEVIGDSITCGYGNLGENATCPFEVKIREVKTPDGKTIPVTVPLTENQYLSFTSQTARNLSADVVTICWSGKGVYKNYKENVRFDPTGAAVPAADATTTVPDLWEKRTIANDATNNLWDFTKEKPEEKPQVVVISLGTNDFARDTKPAYPEDDGKPVEQRRLPGNNIPDGDMNDPKEYDTFVQTYLKFVEKVRANRPDAHIFLATPPMLTDQFPLDNARTKVREALVRIVAARDKAGDGKVYAMDLVEMGFRYGLGCDYHPNLEVHAIMAQQLTGAIRSKTCW